MCRISAKVTYHSPVKYNVYYDSTSMQIISECIKIKVTCFILCFVGFLELNKDWYIITSFVMVKSIFKPLSKYLCFLW